MLLTSINSTLRYQPELCCEFQAILGHKGKLGLKKKGKFLKRKMTKENCLFSSYIPTKTKVALHVILVNISYYCSGLLRNSK